jgi:glyoxylase-like metal-dependent hydrolase (beta-lactamase superfamily II)
MSPEPGPLIHHIPLWLSNAFVIQNGNSGVLVDTGIPGEAERILAMIQKFGVVELNWIFLTHAHYDHMGSTAKVQEATGARVVIQEADAQALSEGRTTLGDVRGRGHLSAWLLPFIERINPVEPVEADLVFNDQFYIPDSTIKIQAYHTPGHTLGSSGLLVEDHHFFAGDLISTTGTPHPQRYYAQDWNALNCSLKRIQALKPNLSYPGHGSRPLELEGLLRMKM